MVLPHTHTHTHTLTREHGQARPGSSTAASQRAAPAAKTTTRSPLPSYAPATHSPVLTYHTTTPGESRLVPVLGVVHGEVLRVRDAGVRAQRGRRRPQHLRRQRDPGLAGLGPGHVPGVPVRGDDGRD
eukprot:604014-Rhodomonas_salina.3